MKKIFALFTAFLLVTSTVITSFAEDGKVTYSGNAGEFIFEPGSEHSLTDLFPDFKNVMPGDCLTQKITVKNNANRNVKVNIYLRALGAHEDSVDFLSKLGLEVTLSDDNTNTEMFDATANETAQLMDWVLLGSLYSGGEINLDVTLEVPVDLDNTYKNAIGCLDWEFMVEEFPLGGGWNPPPQGTSPTPTPSGAAPTGDDANLILWFGLLGVSGVALLVLFFWKRKEHKEE